MTKEEKYEKLLQFVKIKACFSSKEETLRSLAAKDTDSYSKYVSIFALEARELLEKINEMPSGILFRPEQ